MWTMPLSLTTLNFGESVKRIPGLIANECGLTSVVIPDSVTEIGSGAFDHCEALKSVKIGNSVTIIENGAFRDCSSLTSVVIPNSVTKIEDEAFYGCEGLTSVDIPASVTSIGDAAFLGCPLPEDLKNELCYTFGRYVVYDQYEEYCDEED